MRKKTRNVIPFEPRMRLLEKARLYVDDVERFLNEREAAVPLLLRALPYGDRHFKRQVLLLLGGFAKREVAEPLYQIMTDPDEDEDVRHDAAIQLSVTFPFLKDPQPLMDRLLADLKSPDPDLRADAAFALGWEGNTAATIPLIELLYDEDPKVQQTAVNALSNLRDDRILDLMIERLENGPREQKRTILFNLWRFYSRRQAVIEVYLDYLEQDDDDLRFDALVLLSTLTEVREHLDIYHRCLQDRSARIRELALREFLQAEPADIAPFRADIEALLEDPQMKIKQAALQVLRKL
ncbi:MAG TPA: HEAT repeat domain-containing protein [Desulfobacterales bacterium]